MESPVFISGLRKSGTSMTKQLFDGHPELMTYPPNEVHLFRYSGHERLIGPGAIDDLRPPEEVLRSVSRTQFHQRLNNPDAGDYTPEVDITKFNSLVSDATPETYAEVYEILFSSMAKATETFDENFSDVRPVSKTVLTTEFFPTLRTWFPDLQFIYVLRNPYAHFESVRNSLRVTSGAEGQDLSIISDPYPYLGPEIRRMEISYYLMEAYSKLFPDQFYVLVYDDLLRNPEKEIRDLADFLDVEFNDVLTNPTICGRTPGGNSWHVEEDFESIDKRPLTHWKDHIKPLEIHLINQNFTNILDKYEFKKEKTDVSILRPFDISERPWTYIANRSLFFNLGSQTLTPKKILKKLGRESLNTVMGTNRT